MVDFIYLPLLSPSQTGVSLVLNLSCLRGGKEFERGLRPLSPELPFPAINICGFLQLILAGEGIKG
jgi:hypothetical protein